MENDSLVLWGLLAMLVLSVFSLFAIYNVDSVSEQEMKDAVSESVKLEVAKVEMPTAQEVADKVLEGMPEPKEAPEFKGQEQLNDMWNDLYSNESEELKGYAYNDSLAEFEKDDWEVLVEWLELAVEDFDELVSYQVDIKDFEVSVVDLGLKDDEDKVAKVVFDVKIKYDLKNGVDDSFKDYLTVTADVVYEEGDFSDEDVKIVYAFAE